MFNSKTKLNTKLKTFFKQEKSQTALEFIFLVAFVLLLAAFVVSLSSIVIDLIRRFGEHVSFVEEKIANLL